MVTTHPAAHLPVPHAYTIQTWFAPIYSGFAFAAQPCRNRDKEIAGMSIIIHTMNTVVDVPMCTLIEDITAATSEVTELQILQTDMIKMAS